MSEPGAVKQSVLFPEQGIPPNKAKEIRDRYLLPDDWYKEGRVIWIRPSGIQRLAIAEEEPKLAQRFVKLWVIRPAPNPRYVVCSLTKGMGTAVNCLIPRKLKPARMVHSWINAEEIEGSEGKLYRHEYLATQ